MLGAAGRGGASRSRRWRMSSWLALIAARVLRTSGLRVKRRPEVAPAASTPALAGPRRAAQRPAARVSRRSHARCRAALPDQQQADAGQNCVDSAGDGQFFTQHGQPSAGRGDRQQARAHHQQHQVGLAQRAVGAWAAPSRPASTNTSVAARSKLASSEPIGPHSAAVLGAGGHRMGLVAATARPVRQIRPRRDRSRSCRSAGLSKTTGHARVRRGAGPSPAATGHGFGGRSAVA